MFTPFKLTNKTPLGCSGHSDSFSTNGKLEGPKFWRQWRRVKMELSEGDQCLEGEGALRAERIIFKAALGLEPSAYEGV
jgi:hypothetical protein